MSAASTAQILIGRADALAATAHAGQTRKYTGEPYVNHPRRVAEILRSINATPQQIAAGLAHDVVEDTPVTIDEVSQKLGFEVALMVYDLTKRYTKERFPHMSRGERDELERTRIGNILDHSKTVKLADIIDNASSIVEQDRGFARVWIPEKWLVMPKLEGGDRRLHARATRILLQAKNELGIK